MPFLNGPDAVKQIRQLCHNVLSCNINQQPEDLEQGNSTCSILRIDRELLASQLERIPDKISLLMKPFIIVYSGMSDEASKKYALECGSDKYICKPATVA
jgi:DNA-binding response OmpR family regulator